MSDLIEELVAEETDLRVHHEWLRALREPELHVVPTEKADGGIPDDELLDEMEVCP